MGLHEISALYCDKALNHIHSPEEHCTEMTVLIHLWYKRVLHIHMLQF
jgi:hypothetical protein